MIKEEKHCRICEGDLYPVVDLGSIYPSGFVKNQENLFKAPLVLSKCLQCNLVQLQHTIDLDLMYRQYWYTSALNKSMVSSLQDVVKGALIRAPLNEYDVVVDIGCNDGTLFKFYPENIFRIGYDPALNLEERAKETCNIFINDYFSSKLYPDAPKAKIITSIAMFYDLPNPNEFIENIKEVLAEDGIWIIQLTDLYSMLRINAFDNICHEHLEYYSLEVLDKLMYKHGLEIFDVEYNDVNGGSLRIYVGWFGKHHIYGSVTLSLQEENNYFKSFSNPFAAFMLRVSYAENALKSFLIKKKDYTTFILGASTKGNTLLQVWKFTEEDFPYALEVNQEKFGLRTPGSNILIIPEEKGLEMMPDHLLVLPWHFYSSMKQKLSSYLEQGTILVPLPNFSIAYKDGGGVEWMLEQKALVKL